MTKSLFPYRGRLTKSQMEFFAAVCIASFVDHVDTNVPGRWFGKEEDYRRWRQAQKNEMRPKRQVPQMISDALDVLGWNLSILYAQVSGDGLGVGDALSISDLGNTLETWATRWFEGEIGIVRDAIDTNSGKSTLPDTDALARAWTAEVWKWIEEQKAG